MWRIRYWLLRAFLYSSHLVSVVTFLWWYWLVSRFKVGFCNEDKLLDNNSVGQYFTGLIPVVSMKHLNECFNHLLTGMF